MTKPAMVATGVILAVAGGAFALFLEYKGVTHFLPEGGVHPFQVPGDPPVTVADGSFHAHSKKGWMTDQDSKKIILPDTDSHKAGSFRPDSYCTYTDPKTGNVVNATAFLWTDEDNIYDISPVLPAWQVVVTHANGHAVAISVNKDGYLQFKANTKFEDPRMEDDNDRRHSAAGKVTEIDVSGAKDNTGWPPDKVSKYRPHYTLGFCYH